MQEIKYNSLEECVSKIGRENYTIVKPYKLPLKVDGRISEFDITYFEFGPEDKPRRYLVLSKGNLENALNPYVRITPIILRRKSMRKSWFICMAILFNYSEG